MSNSNNIFNDSDWDDIDLSDLVDEPDAGVETEEPASEPAEPEKKEETVETTEANPAEEPKTEEPAEQPAPAPTEEANQLFNIRVLGEDKQLTRDEMIAAAQKGMDYDRIRSKYSELQTEKEANAPALNLVKELADAQGISVEELITNIRAAALAKKENISYQAAAERVKLKAREDAVSKREDAFKKQDEADKAEAAEKEARNRQFIQFFQKHPGVKPADIPQQCFVDMKNGIPLEYSYSQQTAAKKEEEANKSLSEKDRKIKELEDQIAELNKLKNSINQNELNAARSVGSASTDGKQSKDESFDSIWYDGT